MVHLGTIGYGLREFVVMTCVRGPKKGNTYIEEVVLTSVDYTEDVFANCKFIEDDNLANDLANYAREQGLLDIKGRSPEMMEAGLWSPIGSKSS
jgi:hypothetical protein